MTSELFLEIRGYVREGVERLDAKKSDWREEAKTQLERFRRKFRMDYCNSCMVALVCGDWDKGLEELGLQDENGNEDVELIRANGFTLILHRMASDEERDEAWRFLEALWMNEVYDTSRARAKKLDKATRMLLEPFEQQLRNDEHIPGSEAVDALAAFYRRTAGDGLWE